MKSFFWLAVVCVGFAFPASPAPQTGTNAPVVANANSAPAPATNATPHFPVQTYEVTGNTLIPDATVQTIFSRHTGTNLTFADVEKGMLELKMEYHDLGYDTVDIAVPKQTLSNGVFKINVFEGRLAEVVINGNRYFSSNNIRRALPGLVGVRFLNSKFFQAELDRANANQDRQIYPEIHPGPDTNTTALFLNVKDRIPFHAKIEANNQSPPGTPDMRINTSAAYNNLWQLEHSVGVQYTFSEEVYKQGTQWNFYDRPLVANYSMFYRMPLAAPESMADEVASGPGHFGYSEATRKFELPPGTGLPELNVFASGSTIDTGVLSGAPKQLASSPFTNGTQVLHNTIDQVTDHQDLTWNQGIGLRVTDPMPLFYGISSSLQAGLDFKYYKTTSLETNSFLFTQYLFHQNGTLYTNIFSTPNPVPATTKSVAYLPLSLRWDAHRQDKYGTTDFGIGYSPNVWYSGTRSNIQNISGSAETSGLWHIVSASLGREQALVGDWKLALRADGQWSSEPLIGNEQFGIGGVAGVRGYREGEILGDTGWRVTSEVKTPTYKVGYLAGGTSHPFTVRASAFLDYAESYLVAPEPGQAGRTSLLGAGFGGGASIGTAWQARLFFAWPLLNTPTTEAGQVRIMFALTAQY